MDGSAPNRQLFSCFSGMLCGWEGGSREVRKILEDLYLGNIFLYDKRIAANSKLRRLIGRAADCKIN